MSQAMRDRFFRWFWRKKDADSPGERSYTAVVRNKTITWHSYCEALTHAYAAGYRAGRRAR